MPTNTLLTALLAAAMQGAPAAPLPADLILHNGVVHTVDREQPRASAAAVRGTMISAVGDDATVLALRGPETRVIDLDGRFLMPGFNDSHVRFRDAAAFVEFNLAGVTDAETFRARVRDAVVDLPDGQWLRDDHWGASGDFTPDMRDIEDLTAAHPVFLRRFDDGAFAANRAAMSAAGLDPDDPRGRDVVFARDPGGRPTGVMTGPGVARLFGPHVPDRHPLRRREQQTLKALEVLARHGVTSIGDVSDEIQRRIFERLRMADMLTCRVHARAPLDDWRSLMERGVTIGAGDAWVRLGAVHGHADGDTATRTARFFQPYADDPGNRGAWQADMLDDAGAPARQVFLKSLLNADRAGLQLSVHAAGDEANHRILNLLERINRANGDRERRFRLVHAQVIAPEDLSRIGDLDLVAEVQPIHVALDHRRLERRIGPERCRGAWAFRTLAGRGAVLAFGTGWPGTPASAYPVDPLAGLYAAVTRRDLEGGSADGWHPGECLGMEAALRAYTWGPAYACFEERIKGSIAEGRLADLVVLSRNPLAVEPRELLETSVELTVVDGRIVYEKP